MANYNRKIGTLVIVTSITNQKCYDMLLGNCLPQIGIDYSLIKTDAHKPWTTSANSIINYKNLHKSKYIVFVHQDLKFLDKDWGKKIVELCESLPDLGYAGTEGVTNQGVGIGCGFNRPDRRKFGVRIKEPIIVETCDGGTGIIPTKLFLEKQFDENFLWYPVQEDYACWVRFVKKLKVYCLPLKIWHRGCHDISNWKKIYSYDLTALTVDWHRLNKKWGRKINTTCHNKGCRERWMS